MEREEIFDAVRDALESSKEEETAKPHSFSIKPFRALRMLAPEEEQDALVVGLHYNPETNVYDFICVVDDGAGGIYVAVDNELKGNVPKA
jgi:hypothetical protein